MTASLRLPLIPSLIAAACLLAACGGSDGDASAPNVVPVVTGTYPRFDTATSDLPFNSDLIFTAAATSDGTASVGAATDVVRATLNQLDGFSTSAYFDVLIAGSVDPASAAAGRGVYLVELDTAGKDALDPANVVGIAGTADYDVQVVSVDGGTDNAIRIRPLRPLKAKTKYLVVLTSDLKDRAGAPLVRSGPYSVLRNPDAPILAPLQPLRTAIQGWETLASGFLAAASSGALDAAAARDKLVLTYTFTTTDPQTPLVAMAAPRAAIAGLQIAKGTGATEAVAAANALDAAGLLPTPKARALGVAAATGVDFNAFSAQLAANVGKLYTGWIKLPYYQTAPDGLAFGEYLKRPWKPDLTLATALGVTLPADVDGSYNMTYRYPFAAKTADLSVPLQVTLPQASWVPGYANTLNCGQIYTASGYPTVIFVHGITSDRSAVLALAHTLASQCVATVAIDLPLHGVAANSAFVDALNVERNPAFATLYGTDAPRERHFNVAGPTGSPAPMNFAAPTGSDGSGAQFINLGNLTNTRDNNRQAVMDLLNLNASLGALSTQLKSGAVGSAGLDLNRVHVVGQSLGGIVGSVFATVNQLAIAQDRQLGLTSNLNPVKGLVANVAGTQVSQILTNSATFGPTIDAGLTAAGAAAGTSNRERFLYAAQSALDSGDPVSFMQPLAALNVPTLVQQVDGDQVVPNGAAGAPLMGTQALASLLGATPLSLGETQLGRGYVRLNAGDHGSLLRPGGGAPQVTAELQSQVVTFVLNGGKVAVGAQAPANVVAAQP